MRAINACASDLERPADSLSQFSASRMLSMVSMLLSVETVAASLAGKVHTLISLKRETLRKE
ncbi:hypothetical protein D3C79_502540 [compost metagenome]